jgi:glucose/arabinose dehydrogenase
MEASAMTRRGRGLLLGIVLGMLLAPLRSLAQTLTDPTLSVTPIAQSLLNQPTTMEFVGPHDFLVLEKASGLVRRVTGGVLSPTIALDVAVNSDSERGLLGIAVNTATPPAVFLYYTEAAVDGGAAIANRVYRYTWNAATGQLQNPQMILDLPVTPGPNHDGGILVLGTPADGASAGDGAFLYVVIGELNRNGKLQNNSAGADPDDTGVILRIQQDGTPAPGNPFTPYCTGNTNLTCDDIADCTGNGTCELDVGRYYAYGIRNSFGMTRDPVTGSIWMTENGPSNYDEINRVTPGMNSGWNKLMGPDARDPQGLADLFNMPGAGVTYSDPEFSWLTTIAPTGIVLPSGSGLGPAYNGVALVVDSNLGQLYRFPLNAGRTAFDLAGFMNVADLVADDATERNQFRIGSGFGSLTDLTIGPDKQLYIVSIGMGTVYKISGPPMVPGLPFIGLLLLALMLAGAAALALRRSHAAAP